MKSPICHPYEILSKVLAPIGMQPDDAVFMFYEQIREKIVDGPSKQHECQIRQAVLLDYGEDHFIGRNNLLNYTMSTYADPTQFYNFRKQVRKGEEKAGKLGSGEAFGFWGGAIVFRVFGASTP